MQDADATVLIVDDDPAVGVVLRALLEQAGLRALHEISGEAALRRLDSSPVDLVVADLRMPGMDGMELLDRVVRSWPELPVIMLTAHGTVSTAVEAMRIGAADFVLKPFEREEILRAVNRALRSTELAREQPPRSVALDSAIVGSCPAMRELGQLVQRAAQTSATVLVRGETGSGKGLVARAIHDQSARHSGPFVKLHCAAFPEGLLESELFGYEKGAFTGAASRKPGRVELATGGTLFLDEIGDVPLTTQVKLLRVLQEREFERLGGTQTLRVNVRFVAATHRDLESLIERGAFRSDLFYRLNVVPLQVPALRDRREDIEPLARHFATAALAAAGRPQVAFDRGALEALAAQSWPGNVRQLQNLVERLLVFSDGPSITARDVERELVRESRPRTDRGSTAADCAQPTLLDEQRRTAEKEAILQALKRTGDNRSLAARILGVSRSTLYKKLSEYGVT